MSLGAFHPKPVLACGISFGFRGGIFLVPVESMFKAVEMMNENLLFTHAPLCDFLLSSTCVAELSESSVCTQCRACSLSFPVFPPLQWPVQ